MTVEILGWAAGFALDAAAKRIGDHLSANDIEKSMRKEFENWAKTLEAGRGVHPDALFPPSFERTDPHSAPCLRALQEGLQASDIPDAVEWHAALMERWRQVRAELGDDAQAFFLLSEDEASKDLSQLANRLYEVCVRNAQFFRQHVVAELRRISSQLEADVSKLPDPARLTRSDGAKLLARTIESDTLWRVRVVLITPETQTLTVWGSLPSGVPATPQVFLQAACVASGIEGVDVIKIGLCDVADLSGSNATGVVVGSVLVFDSSSVYELATTKKPDGALWDRVLIESLVDANSSEQRWITMPFSEVDKYL